jgi:hypothetical protein
MQAQFEPKKLDLEMKNERLSSLGGLLIFQAWAKIFKWSFAWKNREKIFGI